MSFEPLDYLRHIKTTISAWIMNLSGTWCRIASRSFILKLIQSSRSNKSLHRTRRVCQAACGGEQL